MIAIEHKGMIFLNFFDMGVCSAMCFMCGICGGGS